MLPIFHIIGNVTKYENGSITLEEINDCSGVTYYGGVYHIWHQCCQDHWDHVISKDLIHWQRLPPPIQPLGLKTYDGSISLLDTKDGGPLIVYDAQDGKLRGPLDNPILGVARLSDLDDKYLMTWVRDSGNPCVLEGGNTTFPSQVWRNGEHWNMLAQGYRYQSNDSTFHTWTRTNNMVGRGERGGQWWMPVPNQMDGSPPPDDVPDHIVNVDMGETYRFGNYYMENETFVDAGLQANLEGQPGGKGGWWAGQMANDRMMMIGWALDDYNKRDSGFSAGPGIDSLTRLTLLREVSYDITTKNLVSNPVSELKGLRSSVLASEKDVALPAGIAYTVNGTQDGAAASADVILTFSGFNGSSSPAVFGACVLAGSLHTGIGIGITVHGTWPKQSARVSLDYACGPQSSSARIQSYGDDVPLVNETSVTVRITPDRSLADFFVQGGRWSATKAWPSDAPPRAAGDSQVVVWAATSGVTADIDVFSMSCGWADPSYSENPTM
jgi:hypothetical protein